MNEAKGNGERGVSRWTLELERRLSFLNAREITMIDELLASVAPFGEVRLAVQKGRIRFVSSVKSQDALRLTGKPPAGGKGD